jgi:hypothetical protein
MQLQAIGLHHVAECPTVFFGASQEGLVTGHLGIFVAEFVEVIEAPYGEKTRTSRMIVLSNNITDNLFVQ